MIKNICCIGAGYVGGPTMAVIAEKCPDIKITLVDSNPDKIAAWNGSLDKLPVYEPGLKEIVQKVRGKNLFFSNEIDKNIDESEMIFIAVNTPTKTEGEGAGMAADLKYVIACAKQIAKSSNSDKIVIEKSTLPVRTAEKLKEILYKEGKKGVNFEILSNPEFLAEGTAIKDLYKSDRVLIGGDDTKTGQIAVKKLVKIYKRWISKSKILTTNVWSSELAKLASNAMLAQRISSINSLSALCNVTGAKTQELSKAIGMDKRIGPYFLEPSPGFGGSCFQKDILNLVYLSKFYGLNEVADYWYQVIKINNYQRERFSKEIINHFGGTLKGKRIKVLGWAFKAKTNDTRESSAIFITEKLYNAGAHVQIYDPMVSIEQMQRDVIQYWKTDLKIVTKRVSFSNDGYINEDIDAVAVITEWEEFKSFNFKSLKVFDGRNIIKDSFYSL
jgi:UDPglucose 6-dehydrogenase